jgi:hypothetical protein
MWDLVWAWVRVCCVQGVGAVTRVPSCASATCAGVGTDLKALLGCQVRQERQPVLHHDHGTLV